ncbi:hypothetical protein NGM99_01045 [Mesorhizobium sp. RP14(2022)]|uniref:PIN domain-containing protein n=1 Tax=Mesorhizobium liriopis TaxID=2953882 RepID=A0ABT1C0L8_9HYPH|nr:hypothetical protein [Mesorhizobium liriopis]MCO6048375.1 hypothetical protein [Mesorhizobium liriopis]
MPKHHGPVLLDTNAIIESWRVNGWRALAGGYRLETVEFVVIETQTGMQRRRPEQQIDITVLKDGLAAEHRVTPEDVAAAAIQDGTIGALDTGERLLWSHILSRQDDPWVLCGPDKASLRIGIRQGFCDRMISLERLFTDVGFRPREPLKLPYTKDWLERTLSELAALERGRA